MKERKNLIASLLLALALVASPALAACSTAAVEAPEATEATEATTNDAEASGHAEDEIAVKVTIDGTAGGGTVRSFDAIVPEGCTAFDAVVYSGISYESTDSDYGLYVSAIDGIGENANGTAGGWTFTVNDEMPEVGATEVVLQEGDDLLWSYVLF